MLAEGGTPRIGLSVQIMIDAGDREACYRLRDQVFGDELGDVRNKAADGVQRGCLDSAASILLGCKDPNGLVLGSFRLTPRRLTAFISDELYPFAELAARLGVDAAHFRDDVFLVDRVCVAPLVRRQGVFSEMLAAPSHVGPRYADRALSFEIPHYLRNRVFRRDRDKHMHMIRH